MTKRNLVKRYGFFSNPKLPHWLQVTTALKTMTLHQINNRFKHNQVAFHNLCDSLKPPTGIGKLLWHGLKFIIERPLPKPRLETYIKRLTYDIRVRNFIQQIDLAEDPDYDPKLYLPSEDFTPDPAPNQIEQGIRDFKQTLQELIAKNIQHRQHNLPPDIRRLLRFLEGNKDFIILPTDKNLGPAIMERATYKRRCLQDHLLDNNSYKQLTPAEAAQIQSEARNQMEDLIATYSEYLTANEKTYFERSFKRRARIPQFYITPKVHKTPYKTRPIVSCINSRLGYLSKWVDRKLQTVANLCPAYLKDSQSLIAKLKLLGKLPPTAIIITADAVSMYTNIDTDHSIKTLKDWFQLHKADLPQGFPTNMILAATELIMKSNVFQLDDTYWLQLIGTAMGTSMACLLATIYYSYHEETNLLPTYQQQPLMAHKPPALLLYGRLIDDSVQIWDMAHIPTHMKLNFNHTIATAMAFGKLQWEVEKPSRKVNFLDLTITLEPGGSITTETFVKPTNLHLYIDPTSAHSKGVLKSLIFGNVMRYWKQNTHQSSFISTTRDFFRHLLNRGYTTEVLVPLFEEAGSAIENGLKKLASTATPTKQPAESRHRLFLHWDFHPRDISRKAIRQAYNETLAPVITGSPLGIRQFTIAYSNEKSLRSCLTKTQLKEAPGNRVSNYVEQLEYPPANR